MTEHLQNKTGCYEEVKKILEVKNIIAKNSMKGYKMVKEIFHKIGGETCVTYETKMGSLPSD